MWCVTCSQKGAKTDLVDSNGRKPIDLAGAGAAQRGTQPAPAPAGAANPVASNAGAATEIRALLQNAASQK